MTDAEGLFSQFYIPLLVQFICQEKRYAGLEKDILKYANSVEVK